MPKRIRRLMLINEPTTGEPAGGGQPTPPAATDPSDSGTTAAGEPGDTSKGDEPLGEGGIKALQAERDARKQAEKERDDLLKQIDDSKKTAEQKAADDLKTARDESAGHALRALKYEVAAEKDIPLKFASRLTGATKEELLADADALKEFVTESKPPAPRPNPLQGKSGTPALPESQPGVPRLAAAFEQAIESRA